MEGGDVGAVEGRLVDTKTELLPSGREETLFRDFSVSVENVVVGDIGRGSQPQEVPVHVAFNATARDFQRGFEILVQRPKDGRKSLGVEKGKGTVPVDRGNGRGSQKCPFVDMANPNIKDHSPSTKKARASAITVGLTVGPVEQACRD